jgi:F0F1-type ATP synthase gamma subunit
MVIEKFEAEEFDVCTIFYNQFKNVITQIPQAQQIIPLKVKMQRKINPRIVTNLNQMKMKF